MTKLKWGTVGDRFYETGTDRGVLYLDGLGVAWNGLVSVQESPSGGEAKESYIDGVKYANRSAPEDFSATIEAYTYPTEFEACDGFLSMANGLQVTQQARKPFGLAYRTKVGNDLDGLDHAYKIHLIYNALATPSNRQYKSLSDSPEAITFSWKISTKPVKFDDPYFGMTYGAHVVIDSRVVYPWALEALEAFLYGSDTKPPRFPTPDELLRLFVDNALLKVMDNGDGTWTATGPDEAFVIDKKDPIVIADINDPGTFVIQNNSIAPDTVDVGLFLIPAAGLTEDPNNPGLYETTLDGLFSISWPSAIMLDTEKYTISSL